MSDEERLLAAASLGDIDQVKELLQKNVNVNAINAKGQTSLHLAVEHGHEEVVKLLCDNHANILIKDKQGLSVLLAAALNLKGKKLVNYFLDKGSKFDSEIHEAAFKGDLDKVKKCIQDLKISTNTPDVIGNTALLYAAANDHLNVVQWLLKEGGAKIDEKSNDDVTALLFAAVNGHLEVVKWLLKEGGAKVDEKDNYGDTALLYAAWNGQLEVVKWLIKEGRAKIDEKNNNGTTTLLCAALNGHLEVVKWLLKEGGAKINEKSNDGNTALLCAAQNGQIELVKWLLKEGGAKFDEKNNYGDTALLHAAYHGQLEVVKWLIKEGGAKIDEKNNNGNTALLRAALNGHLEIVKFLIKEGGGKNNNSSKALFWASLNGHLEVVKFLIKEGGARVYEKDNNDMQVFLFTASDDSHLEVVKFLIKEGGAKINEKDNNGDTALLCAAQNGQIELVKWLIKEGGAKIDEKSNNGDTALLCAASNGHLEVVNWLLKEGGAKIDEKNNNGNTALLCAAYFGRLELVKWLLKEGGAKVDEKNYNDKTALLYAVWFSHKELVKWLILKKKVKIEKGIIEKLPDPSASKFLLDLYVLYQLSQNRFSLFEKKLIEANRYSFNNSFREVLIELIFDMSSSRNLSEECHVIISNWFKNFNTIEKINLLKLAVKYFYMPIFAEINMMEPILEFKINKIKFDIQQVKALEALFLHAQELNTLELCKIVFTESGYNGFLAILASKNKIIEKITLINCGLGDNQLITLASTLQQFTNLKYLNLAANKISNLGFERISLKLPNQLKYISIENNLIDYKDSEHTIRKLTELAIKLSNIEIDITGNLIESNKFDKITKELIRMFLIKLNIPIEVLFNSHFNKISKISVDEYIFSLKLPDEKIIEVKLSYPEICNITQAKMLLKIHTDEELFKYLFMMREKKILINNTILTQSAFGNLSEAKLLSKKLLDYHPKAPLKSYIRTHAFFKSASLTNIQSLLLPKLTVTLQTWIVYVIAKTPKKGDILGQHAWLAYEGLTRHGQRIFKVANLTTPLNGYWEQFKNFFKGDGQAKIDFFEVNNHQEKTIKYFKENCIIAGFLAEREKVKELNNQVIEDSRQFPQKYKIIISSSKNEDDKRNEIVNCVKWAIDKVETHLGVKVPDDCKGSFIPYNVVDNLRKLGEPVKIVNTDIKAAITR